jgi:chemotaxis protein MotB
LNSVTQEQLEGVANHFAPISVSESTSVAGGVLGGNVLSKEGAQTAESSRSFVAEDLPPPKAGEGSGGPNTQSTEEALEEELKKKEKKNLKMRKKNLKKRLKIIQPLRSSRKVFLSIIHPRDFLFRSLTKTD